MQITFSNLGPVAEATIDTEKKLNVIIGENGLGKTYLSIMVYAISYIQSNVAPRYSRLYFQRDFLKSEVIDAEFKDCEVQNDYREFEIPIDDIVKLNNTIYTKGYSYDLLNEVFASGNIKQNFSDIKIDINNQDFLNRVLELDDFTIKVYDSITITKNNDTLYFKVKNEEDIDADDMVYILHRYLSDCLIPVPFFFSAERGTVNIFNKELSITRNESLDHLLAVSNKKGKFNKVLGRNKRYILPVRELLAFADDITEISKNKGEYAYLANEIEEEILKGKLTVDENEQILFTSDKAKDKTISLDMSASSVKTMASLTLFLRHKATKGMTIFIDEPELNLHPNMQVQIAKIIVKMINHGIKVFVSTHSDYIVRELNNMVIANEVKDNEHYEKDFHLNKSDVVVTRLYYEKSNSRKLKTDYVEVEEDGFSVPSIDDVIVKQEEINDNLIEKLDD